MTPDFRPTRRRLLSTVLGTAVAGFAGRSAVAASGLQLVYITANNCPYCAAFYYNGLSEMKALASGHGVAVRVVDVPKFQSYVDAPFPSDLEWLKTAGFTHGTPKFVLIRGGAVVEHAQGEKAYHKKIEPILRQA